MGAISIGWELGERREIETRGGVGGLMQGCGCVCVHVEVLVKERSACDGSSERRDV